jgi:Rrf2 family protein
MNASSRFAVAVHILTLLAYDDDHPVTSEFVAGSVNTNPVVIRRILGALRDAKLVSSRTGVGGGWRLARSPDAITLRDAYRAVEVETLFPLPQRSPNPACPVGRTIQRGLEGVFREAEVALDEQLARTTVAHMLEGARAPTR